MLLPPAAIPATWLVFVHGGGWVSGAPEDGLPILRAAVAAGCGGASIGYRLAPEVTHPGQARDVAHGVSHLLEALALPPEQVVLSGHSAGAQLLFWLAFERATARSAGWDPAAMAGLVGLSGVFDLPRAGRVAVMRRDWIRPAFGDESDWAAASPLCIVTGDLPPVLLLNAEQDWGLPRQGEQLLAALQAAGVSAARETIPERNHLSIVERFGEPGDPAAAAVLSFVRRVARAAG